MVTRVALETPGIEVAAINDPFMSAEYMAYLLTHDSVHGRYFKVLYIQYQ